jgi:hypothetical protein
MALAIRLTDAYAPTSRLATFESAPGGTQRFASRGAVEGQPGLLSYITSISKIYGDPRVAHVGPIVPVSYEAEDLIGYHQWWSHGDPATMLPYSGWDLSSGLLKALVGWPSRVLVVNLSAYTEVPGLPSDPDAYVVPELA